MGDLIRGERRGGRAEIGIGSQKEREEGGGKKETLEGGEEVSPSSVRVSPRRKKVETNTISQGPEIRKIMELYGNLGTIYWRNSLASLFLLSLSAK